MKEIHLLIDTDLVSITDNSGNRIALTIPEWHYLCDACAEYLGFNRSDIDAALKGVTEQ